ncbi:hypothetical protein [Flammeovirga pacifica]|uniref:TonB C-terminal domain-containing protein n=1 Tax=Flammeovirga pacifica TaxID=915059 RepID=A0A1S1YTE4_FLAPC|nr:hypothetical protein [Flammeovirga pacifica]OHX64276.1 hypothetical protein NH26_21990 [Flammeovirga pacifica]
MKTILPLILLFFTLEINAQNPNDLCIYEIDSITNLRVYTDVDTPACVDIHLSEKLKEIGKTTRFSMDYKQLGIEIPKFYFAFVVTKTGEITGQRMINYNQSIKNLDEIFEIVTEGNWSSAQCNGKDVHSLHVIPILFHSN